LPVFAEFFELGLAFAKEVSLYFRILSQSLKLLLISVVFD